MVTSARALGSIVLPTIFLDMQYFHKGESDEEGIAAVARHRLDARRYFTTIDRSGLPFSVTSAIHNQGSTSRSTSTNALSAEGT
jgi:hypothetical protein